MAIPDFQTIMLPLLQLTSDGRDWLIHDARRRLADDFGLTDDEREQLLPSGRQQTFANRVAWAGSYLRQARLLESAGRAKVRITPRGREVLASPPSRITIRFLEDFPEFKEFRSRRSNRPPAPRAADDDDQKTPEELFDVADTRLRDALEIEVLDRVKHGSPTFFEHVVLQLLTAMGYGGSVADAAAHLGRSGDDGVDGVINEDKLGLDSVYVQAKRYIDHPVRRPEVQSFAGSLEGQRARKGVFITTSRFTNDAIEYTGRIEKRIVLIDGEELARLMIDHGVGVTTLRSYSLLRLDETFFEGADA